MERKSNDFRSGPEARNLRRVLVDQNHHATVMLLPAQPLREHRHRSTPRGEPNDEWNDVNGQALVEGPSLGFAVPLRHGMSAWLHAWALCPRPAAPAPRTVQPPDIPHLVRLELAQVLAHMALAHQETAWT
jgi:hypothetical protein